MNDYGTLNGEIFDINKLAIAEQELYGRMLNDFKKMLNGLISKIFG